MKRTSFDAPAEPGEGAGEGGKAPGEGGKAPGERGEGPGARASRTDAGFEVLVGRTEGVQPWRRAFHAAGGVALAVTGHAAGADSAGFRWLLAAAVVVGFGIDAVRLRRSDVNAAFFGWFRALASPREARGVASSSWFAMGALATALLLPAHFVPAMLVVGLADPAASVAGRLWGTRPLGKGSVQGTAAFFVVASAALIPFAGVALGLTVAFAAAALEALPTGLDDNLSTPIAVAAALSIGESLGG